MVSVVSEILAIDTQTDNLVFFAKGYIMSMFDSNVQSFLVRRSK